MLSTVFEVLHRGARATPAVPTVAGSPVETPVRIEFVSYGAEIFPAVVSTLCAQSTAVLTMRSGEEIGAVLLSSNEDTVVFEHWYALADAPSGVIDACPVADIAKVKIY
jgi:hypothetical protein